VSRTDATPTRVADRQERDLDLLDAYWRAANHLSDGRIHLLEDPLLREPLRAGHVKSRLLGHCVTTPGRSSSSR
jgi:xylulose-5-phosphate/fructose-6-phosphate phosphoketolase